MPIEITDNLIEIAEKSFGFRYQDWPAEVLALAASRMYGHGYFQRPPFSTVRVNSHEPDFVISLKWMSGPRVTYYYRVNTVEKTGEFLGKDIPLENFLRVN